MMKKMMAALAALALCGTASAATVFWQWTPSGSFTEEDSMATRFQMVASDVQLSAAEVVLTANPNYSGEGVEGASAPDSSTVSVIGSDYMTPFVAGPSLIAVLYTTDVRPGSPAIPEIDLGSNGRYLYLVVLNDTEETFAVTSAGVVTKEMMNGDPLGESSTVGDREGEMTWVGGTYTDVMPTNIPEPTALALIALGVAGVTLRRRVA